MVNISPICLNESPSHVSNNTYQKLIGDKGNISPFCQYTVEEYFFSYVSEERRVCCGRYLYIKRKKKMERQRDIKKGLLISGDAFPSMAYPFISAHSTDTTSLLYNKSYFYTTHFHYLIQKTLQQPPTMSYTFFFIPMPRKMLRWKVIVDGASPRRR